MKTIHRIIFLLFIIMINYISSAQGVYIFNCDELFLPRKAMFEGKKIALSITDNRNNVSSARKEKIKSKELIGKIQNSVEKSYPDGIFIKNSKDPHFLSISISIVQYCARFYTGVWQGNVELYVVIENKSNRRNKRISKFYSESNKLGYTTAKKVTRTAFQEAITELLYFIDEFDVNDSDDVANSENSYKEYLKNRIDRLDPIEGIYDVRIEYHFFAHGRNLNEAKAGKVAIVRAENNSSRFFVYPISSETGFDGRDYFERIGETNVYNYNAVFNDFILKERMTLSNLFEISMSVTLTPNFFISIGGDEKNSKGFVAYNFIKEYPTKSMYENAIINGQQIDTMSWSGTGWALGNCYLVTNNHVTEGAKTIMVKGVDGNFNIGYTAEVVTADKVNDLTILRITDSNFKGFGALPYGVSSRIADVGEDVFVLGYPLAQALGNEIKLTNGIISSRTGYQGDVSCYQMSAPVQPGNSGGPMFDNKGNVIGIIVAGVPGAENVGYAIKTSYLKILIESADLGAEFSDKNTISTLSLAEKVKRVKKFVYYIECGK